MSHLVPIARRLGRGLALVAIAPGVVVLLLALAGKFTRKVPSAAVEKEAGGEATAATPPGQWATVRSVHLPRFESCVGSVRAVHETSVGSKLLARVLEVKVRAGQEVKEGDVLVLLDDADLKAKRGQALAAVTALDAALKQAELDANRASALWRDKAISGQEYERAVTAQRTAEADVRRAQQALAEVDTQLQWATVRSPMDGKVIDKMVQAGDTVSPGQTLARLYSPKRMQLVASVRESLRDQLAVGQAIGVRIESLDKQCTGTISEIVPEAESASRAFQVKVTGPCPPGVELGRFGRIEVPLRQYDEVAAIPRAAVRRVGQLELVSVADGDRVLRRAIRTGRHLGEIQDKNAGDRLFDQVEVLSGLTAGEKVLLPASAPAAQETGRD